jgi:hypothetical protein
VTSVIGSTRRDAILPAMAPLYDLGSAVLGAIATHPVLAAVLAVLAGAALAAVARRRGWHRPLRRHPRITVAILIPVLAVSLPVGWYLTSPLVLTASLDEPPPIVSAGASPGASVAPAASASPATRASALPGTAVPSARPPAPTATATPAPPLVARSGPFHGSDEFHFGRGTARLIETAPGTFVVRLERFAVRNGPDLYVYLSPSPDGFADGAIELGRLKADTGNQNYAVPAGALPDPARAASVVIWCKQFSHLFATAPLGG